MMRRSVHFLVIAGLVPVIHLSPRTACAAWIARTSRAMTAAEGVCL